MNARYRFAVQFRLEPAAGVRIDPTTFETTLLRPADRPGEPGWLFFRDNLWRSDLADEAHVRDLAAEALGVTVVSVDCRAFETDREYLDALEATIAADLGAFRADSTSEALNKYFGSSIEAK